MPSPWHDSANELFKEHPELAGHILRDIMGVDLAPETPLVLAPGDFTDRPSRDLLADTVIVAGSPRKPVRGIIVEIQQKKDKEKRRQWPRYAAAMWLRHDCPVDLLVICPDEATAAWYAEPIPTTLDGYTHRPKVLLPAAVPAVTDAAKAGADPAMAVLSLAYHGHEAGVADAFAAGITALGTEAGKDYYVWGLNMSPEAVRMVVEESVRTNYRDSLSPLLRGAYGDGLLEGDRRAVLRVLKARHLDVTDSQRERITACTDPDQLEAWAEAAVTATDTGQLFG